MSDGKQFQRRKEDFACGHCGQSVSGDGYTNHCPRCLWSQHVDVQPGDRAALCGGLMEPISLEQKDGEQKLTHRCVACGHEKKNRTSREDSFDVIVALAKKIAESK